MLAKDCRFNQNEAHDLFGELLTVKVNPAVIEKQVKKTVRKYNDILHPKQFHDYFIVGGNWDIDYTYIEADRNYNEMRELIENPDYKNTYSYQLNIEEWLNGIPPKDHNGRYFNSIAAINRTYEYYLSLIASMSKNGYIKSRENIGVAIAPTGELYHFRTGHHRLAIAKLLKLDEVTIKIYLVHLLWLEEMKRIYGQNEIRAIKKGIKRGHYNGADTGKQTLLRKICQRI